MTPKYRQQMVLSVVREMNRLYQQYLERNPTFNGTVSIYGHSLGSILSYDIVSRQGEKKGDESENTEAKKRRDNEVDITDMLATGENGGYESIMDDSVSVTYEPLVFPVHHLYGKLIVDILSKQSQWIGQ
jgi:hypothetical protein